MVSGGYITRPAGGTLTMEEIAGVLGVSKRSDGKYHLEDLCTATGINIWSPYKPVRNTLKNGNLTLADMQAANYGFDLSSIVVNGSTLVDVARLAADQGIAAAGSWNGLYARPRGRRSTNVCEWYRLLDFNGYYHYAECPYDQLVVSAASLVKRIGGIGVIKNSDQDASPIALEDLAGITSQIGRSFDEWRLGAIARKGASYTNPVIHEDTLADCWVDSGTEIYASLPSIDVPTYGVWDVVVFMTDYDPDDDPEAGNVYSAIYVPLGYDSANVANPAPQPINPSSLDFYLYDLEWTPTYDPVDGDVTALSVEAEFDKRTVREPEVTLHVDLWAYEDVEGETVLVKIASGSDTNSIITSGDTVQVDLTGFAHQAEDIFVDMWYEAVDGATVETYYVDAESVVLYDTGPASNYRSDLGGILESDEA